MGHCRAGCVTSVVTFTFGILPAVVLEIVVEECVCAYLRAHGIHTHRLDGLVRELIVFPLAFATGFGTIYGIDLLDQKRDAAKKRRREARSREIRGTAPIPDAIQQAFEEYLAALAVARAAPGWE